MRTCVPNMTMTTMPTMTQDDDDAKSMIVGSLVDKPNEPKRIQSVRYP